MSVECWAAQLPSDGSPLIGVGYIGRHRNTVDETQKIVNRVIVYDTQSAAQHAAQVKLVCCLFVIYRDIAIPPIPVQRLRAPEAAASKEGSVDLSLPQ
jgi:hypothetical protein